MNSRARYPTRQGRTNSRGGLQARGIIVKLELDAKIIAHYSAASSSSDSVVTTPRRPKYKVP